MRGVSTLGVLIGLALVVARLMTRSTVTTVGPERLTPADHAAPPAAPIPQPANFARVRGGLKRFLDPIVLVTSAAAIASGMFAYQTNQINKHQSELLDRQVAIEESLALPVFIITMEVDADSDGVPVSHWISIDNSGGMANDLTIDILPFASFWWENASDEGEPQEIDGDELPILGHFDEYNSVLPSRMIPNEHNRLGYEGNAAMYEDTARRIGGLLNEEHQVTDPQHVLQIVVELNYVDYLGEERNQYYFAEVDSAGEVFPPGQFLRLETGMGAEIEQDYYEKFDDRFLLRLDDGGEPPDDDLIRDVTRRIYTNAYVDDIEATPVARTHHRPDAAPATLIA